MRFVTLDHTADVGVEAYGETLAEAFENAALGMFSQVVDVDRVRPVVERCLEVTAHDQEELLVAWLNELVFLFDVENLVFSSFSVTEMSEKRLCGCARGETVDPTRHRLHLAIKSTTYHQLEIRKDDRYMVRVIFDV
jgi:SHS2 domain-containing protein